MVAGLQHFGQGTTLPSWTSCGPPQIEHGSPGLMGWPHGCSSAGCGGKPHPGVSEQVLTILTPV